MSDGNGGDMIIARPTFPAVPTPLPFQKLGLTNFKSFAQAEVSFGRITTVIGANASGKSNVRDAFRFLHGIARGYALADIIGQKFAEGGYREWNGIRGGIKEIVRFGAPSFKLDVILALDSVSPSPRMRYIIEVSTANGKGPARVVNESLYRDDTMVFDSNPPDDPVDQVEPLDLLIRLPRGGNNRKHGKVIRTLSQQPAITQVAALIENEGMSNEMQRDVHNLQGVLKLLESIRFVDFSPDAMRIPSTPGQFTLTDQGENLSSVLQAICSDPRKKAAMISRVAQLTPMEVADLEFVEDSQGKILLQIVEHDGRRISANSASDGTLRFLGIVAALLGPRATRFYFIEEIDNGIHPVRMHLLFNFLEKQTDAGHTQVFATTHSPQWLRFMSPERLEAVSLAYRVEGVPETRLISLDKVDYLREVIANSDIARLYEGGWMEETMFFKEGIPKPVELDEEEENPAHGGAGA
jgi:predicted ATPase